MKFGGGGGDGGEEYYESDGEGRSESKCEK